MGTLLTEMSLAPQIRLPIAAFCWLLPLRFLVPRLSRWVFEAIPLLTLLWLIWCLWRGGEPGEAPASSTTGLDAAHKCDAQATIGVSLAQVEGDSSQITLASGPSPEDSDASCQSSLNLGPENTNSPDEEPVSITSTTRLAPSSSEPQADLAYSNTATEEKVGTNPYAERPRLPEPPRANVRNGKGKAMQAEVFDMERAWVVGEVQGGAASVGDEEAGPSEGSIAMDGDGEADDRGPGGVECQCCFAYYPFGKMVQCPKAHLFCFSCISTYASTKLGADDCSINCMHPSGCVLPFPPSELERVLHPKLMSHYELVKRQKEVEAAALEGQEEYKENPVRCGSEEGPCGAVSCGMCKEGDLLPESCKDVEEDKLLDGRHVIEEAMTRALIRNCPKCQKAFVKELGCNKMTCPKCLTLSCYICRQVITDYEHFDQWPVSTSTAGAKCVLWDSVEQRHADEVGQAADEALLEYKLACPDVDESAIKIDLPPEPPHTGDSAPGLPGHVPAFPYPFPALYPPGYNPYAANILRPAGGGPAYDPLMGLYQPPYFGPPVPVERNQNQYPMVDRQRQLGLVRPAAPAPAPVPAPVADVQADRGAVLLQELRRARLQREEHAAQVGAGPLPRKVRREMAKRERKREREEQRVAAARLAQADLAVRLREMRGAPALAPAQVGPMGAGGAGVGGGDGAIGDRRMGGVVQAPAALVRRAERKR